MHTSAIGLKHKLKQLPTDITIKYKHYLTLKSFLHADHQTIPAKQQNRLQAKKYSLYVYKPNVQTVQTQAQRQPKNKHISVYNAYSYTYTTTSAKQHRGQINTVKQRMTE